MAKPKEIELTTRERIPILYEDRSVLAIDKPPGWMLVPFSWQNTGYNLQAALESSIQSGAFWARCRQIKFLKAIHRLDADTTGVLLLARSPGAVNSYSALFESRRMEKRYLAVVRSPVPRKEWVSREKIGPDPRQHGRMRIDGRNGKPAETAFKVLIENPGWTLLEARPYTGRTHQIRLHLANDKLPIAGDALYDGPTSPAGLGLRAVELSYGDPFTRRRVRIVAPETEFLKAFGFASSKPGDAGIGPGQAPPTSAPGQESGRGSGTNG